VIQKAKKEHYTYPPKGNCDPPNVWYKGKACINLIIQRKKDISEPLLIINTKRETKKGLHIYFGGMKIEQSFQEKQEQEARVFLKSKNCDSLDAFTSVVQM
jgi:S-adenosylmethionine:tRNA-ribosyltransferase-isomerase (queuine synthetase)